MAQTNSWDFSIKMERTATWSERVLETQCYKHPFLSQKLMFVTSISVMKSMLQTSVISSCLDVRNSAYHWRGRKRLER